MVLLAFALWILLGMASYGLFLEPYLVRVNHVSLHDHRLAKALKGKIAVQLSDIHIGKIGEREEKVLGIVERIKPDFIFLTGDYVRWNGNYNEPIEFLSRLHAKSGVWAVMGDYDYSRSRMSCIFCHEQGRGEANTKIGIRFLRNNAERVQLENGTIWIGGLDLAADSPFSEGKIPVDLDDKQPMIILSHSPLNFDLLDEDREVLMLSGDTHGGQIPLPSWLWRLLGYEKNAKYPEGLFEKGRKKMYVSRGIGTSHIPFRLFKRPEVVVLHFG